MSETRLVGTEAEIRISADSHMAEPFDLWEKRMPENLRDRAQRYPNLRYGQGLHAREGGRNPAVRLQDMAADGISAEVLYPTLGKDMYRRGYDAELAEASAHAYNDWMIEFCQEAPDRFWGQAEICLWNIDLAIREMERAKENRLVGATIWMIAPDDLPFTSDHYDRFWAAAQDLEMPVSMHINQGFGPYAIGPYGLQRAPTFVEAVSSTCGGHKTIIMQTLTELMCSGVFERCPRLKLVVAELEVGWIPFWLEDMDRRWLKSKGHEQFSLLPSEYFHRQIYATFTQDEVGGFLLQKYGADNFMWSNDYPHPGCIWPYSDEVIDLTLSELSTEVRAKVLRENVAQLYGMRIPAPMPRQAPPDMDRVWPRPWIRKE